jgi:hypothetical protein
MLGLLYLFSTVEPICSALESFGGGHDKLKVSWHFSLSKDYQQIQIVFIDKSSYEYHIHVKVKTLFKLLNKYICPPPPHLECLCWSRMANKFWVCSPIFLSVHS